MPKCEHGVYDPHGNQMYCSVCNPIPIEAAMIESTENSNIGVVAVLKNIKIPIKTERKWENKLEKKSLGKKQLELDEPLPAETLTSSRKRDGNEDFAALRKKLDGDSSFVSSGHQIIKIRSREREMPDWAASRIKIQNILLAAFPKLREDKTQREAASRWAMVINLFYRMNLTYSQIGRELKISEDAVMKIVQRINRTASAPIKRPRGRPKKK